MPTLVVEKSERAGIGEPFDVDTIGSCSGVKSIGLGKEFSINHLTCEKRGGVFLAGFSEAKQNQLRLWQRVTRLAVGAGEKLRLKLILRGGFYHVEFSRLYWLEAIGNKCSRIR